MFFPLPPALVAASLVAGVFVAPFPVRGQELKGAGGGFASPLVQRWAEEFQRARPGIRIDWQRTGTAEATNLLREGKVDFAVVETVFPGGAADVPEGSMPLAAGCVAVAYNLPGIGSLNLSREALTAIFSGKITRWNDPVIVRDNPGEALPDLPVNVATRQEGSGAGRVFRAYLNEIGGTDTPADPSGANRRATPAGIVATDSEKMTLLVKKHPGAIGFLADSYAAHNRLAVARIQNGNGRFVSPSSASGAAALNSRVTGAAGAEAEGLPADAYPIVAVSWLVVPASVPEGTRGEILREFVVFGEKEGREITVELGYLPLPDAFPGRTGKAPEPGPEAP